jgi:hypothetical protein
MPGVASARRLQEDAGRVVRGCGVAAETKAPWFAPSGPSLSSASPPRTLSGSQGTGSHSGYGGGPTLRGQGGCGTTAPWPPLPRVPAHRVLVSAVVESAPPPPLVRGTAAARWLATDGSDPAKKLSLRPPSGSLPATSASPAAARPANKPSSASIAGCRPSGQEIERLARKFCLPRSSMPKKSKREQKSRKPRTNAIVNG